MSTIVETMLLIFLLIASGSLSVLFLVLAVYCAVRVKRELWANGAEQEEQEGSMLIDSDVPYPVPLTADDIKAFAGAVTDVHRMALDNAAKRPKMTTLVEEFAEAVLASRGKHDDPLELELMQIASVCINLVWQIRTGADVANLRTRRE